MYLNTCVTALYSEDLGASGATVPFSVELILIELEGGRYAGPLLPDTLVELVGGRCGGGGGGDSSGGGCGSSGDGGVRGGGGNRNGERGGGTGWGVADAEDGVSGGAVRVWVHYGAHLPGLSLREEENSRTILTVISMVQGHVL